jgi:hypothetical protein
MYRGSTKTRKAIAVFTLALGGFASPVFASETNDCYQEVLATCNDALEDASWWEKPAIGLFCTGMLAGCAFESL